MVTVIMRNQTDNNVNDLTWNRISMLKLWFLNVSVFFCRWASTFSQNNCVSLDDCRLSASREQETTDDEDHGTINSQKTRQVSCILFTKDKSNKSCQIL